MKLQEKAKANGATYWESYKVKVGDIKEALKDLKSQLFLVHTDQARKDLIDEIFGEKFL